MSRGMPKHTGDPNIQQGGYDAAPDGIHRVNGIRRVISTNDKGDPIFVTRNSQLVIMFEFAEDGGGAPPCCSATPGEFWTLITTLGGVVPTDPSQRTSSQAVTRAIESLKNITTKTIAVESHGGWVNADRIPDVTPPRGKYAVRFLRAHRPDFEPGNYHFQKKTSKFDDSDYYTIIAEFEIVGYPNGKPSPYDGYRIAQFMNDPFTDLRTDEQGNTIEATVEGIPLWAHDKNGGVPVHVRNWEIFVRFFAPGVWEDHDWVVDPSASPYGVSEVLEPQYVIFDYARKAAAAGKKINIYYKEKPRGKGMTFEWVDIPIENAPNADVPDAVEEDAAPQPTALFDLVTFIEKKWPEVKVFDQSDANSSALVFTAEGKQWAAEKLGGDNGPWQMAGLDLKNRKPLHTLTEEEISKLLSAMKTRWGDVDQASGW